MLSEELPILSQEQKQTTKLPKWYPLTYIGERIRRYQKLEDFDPLPPMIHQKIREFLRTETPCSNCVKPLCSCSGANRSQIVFLPGEREWSERELKLKYRGDDPNQFTLAGDCLALHPKTKGCNAGLLKPFDCISFPLQPVVLHNNLVPMFAKSCSIHPADLDPLWVMERWEAWKYIYSIIPQWVEIYGKISVTHET